MNARSLCCTLSLLGCAVGQSVPATTQPESPLGDELAQRLPTWTIDRVLYDEPGDGRLWVRGTTWKGSFGTEGFLFVPFFGAEAPRNFPMRFRVLSVHIGGHELPFAASTLPERTGDRVTFDRGALHEVYELGLTRVEQSFVIDTRLSGDVDLELAIDSELAEHQEQPGLQFGNEFGTVDYSAACLVRDDDKVAIESTWTGGSVHFHVAADQRGEGPVVIDPFVTPQSTLSPGPISSHDISYDAGNDRYLVCWETPFSTTDHDVWSMMVTNSGVALSSTAAAMDYTTLNYTHPSVANLKLTNRFLVAMERTDPAQWGGRVMIYARRRDAGGAMTTYPEVQLSDPSFLGNNYGPDVGGDPGTDPGTHEWLVVWTNVTSGTDSNIHARQVGNSGQPTSYQLVIEDQPNAIYSSATVSQSNGYGIVSTPAWFVVYVYKYSANDWDVVGRMVQPLGYLSTRQYIDTSLWIDLYPRVSSPAKDSTGLQTLYLVTYERQGSFHAMAKVYNGTTPIIVATADLTQQFGLGGYYVRPESDGIRFAVASGAAAGPAAVATLAYANGALLMHEAPQPLPGLSIDPQLVSTYSSGGLPTRFGLTFLDSSYSVPYLRSIIYDGHSPGPMTNQRAMACNGLGIGVSGSTALGNTLQFTLSGLGADFPGFAFGAPSVPAIPLCPTCSLGLRLDVPIIPLFGSATLVIAIPGNTSLVGETYSVQGTSLGSGSCLGGLSFSDTIDFTIR